MSGKGRLTPSFQGNSLVETLQAWSASIAQLFSEVILPVNRSEMMVFK
jgi:hypothetical protein